MCEFVILIIFSYSLDHGKSFDDFLLGTDSSINVQNIITEPDSTSLRFIVLGKNNVNKDVSVAMDFADILKKACVNDTDTANSDFELWDLKSIRGEQCVMGHVSQYYRRKSDRKCYIGDLYSAPPKVVRNCECTMEDFECSPGFYRTEQNTCEPMPGLLLDWSGCNGGYSERPGAYRKVAMSTCERGLDMNELERRSCGYRSTGALLAFILIPSILLLGGFGFYMHRRAHGGRIQLTDAVEPWIPMKMSGLTGWIPESMKSWFGRLRGSVVRYTPLDTDEDIGPSEVVMDDY